MHTASTVRSRRFTMQVRNYTVMAALAAGMLLAGGAARADTCMLQQSAPTASKQDAGAATWADTRAQHYDTFNGTPGPDNTNG